MNKIYSDYFDEYIKLFPTFNDMLTIKKYDYLRKHYENDISPEHLKKQEALYTKYLKKTKGNDTISKTFKYILETNLGKISNNFHLIPLSASNDKLEYFLENAMGDSSYKFKNKQDYLFFMQRTKEFTIYINQAILNMKIGTEKGIVMPKISCRLLIKKIKYILENKKLDKIKKEKSNTLYHKFVKEELQNCINKLYNFLKRDYLNNCRDSIGLSDMPDGEKMYRFLVREMTTLKNLKYSDIHNYGLKEVIRLNKILEQIKKENGYEGKREDFEKKIFTKDFFYTDEKKLTKDFFDKQNEILDTFYKDKFDINIKNDYSVHIMKNGMDNNEYFSAYYIQPGLEDKDKGIVVLNINNKEIINKADLESLVIHEAIPGHHLQLSYLMKSRFPLFLKITSLPGYEEGWAMYCEDYGEYKDTMGYYGKIKQELIASMRLVIDTGIHYYGWSYQKCVQYYKKYLPSSNKLIKMNMDRYINDPAQGLSYKIGKRLFVKLKKNYKGSDKNFNQKIIALGPMPLDILKNIEI